MNGNIERLLISFIHNKWNYQVNFEKKIASSTKPKNEEHMFFVMDNSIHEEHLSRPLESNNEQFKKAVAFLTGDKGSFYGTNKNVRLYFTMSVNDDNFDVKSIPLRAYEKKI